MGVVDLHVHTNKSPCGLHTLLEVVALARQKKMELVAITDHDHGKGTGIRVLSYRFPKTYEGLRVLAGIEFSIRDGGVLEVPAAVKLEDLDICLAGFHQTGRTIRDDPRRCTDDLERLLDRYPFVDILVHPTMIGFELEPERTAALLARHGVAVEANNSALRYAKEHPERLARLLRCCVARGVMVAVDSDAHTAPELGADELANRVLEQAGVPDELVLTASVARVEQFIEQRRRHKLAAGG